MNELDLAWKRRFTNPWRAAFGLVAIAMGVIASWWLASRVLIPEYRPELLGVTREGDSAHPGQGAVYWTLGLGFVGLGFAVVLVAFGPRRPPGARRIAAAVVLFGLLVAAGTVAARSEARCSLETYTGETTCASRGSVLAAELTSVLAPGGIAVGCLAAGARMERQRHENRR